MSLLQNSSFYIRSWVIPEFSARDRREQWKTLLILIGLWSAEEWAKLMQNLFALLTKMATHFSLPTVASQK